MGRTSSGTAHRSAQDSTAAVDAFMATLQHPHTAAIERLRAVILGASSSIAEGIKWNAPSFRTHEYFATVHLRAKTGIALILHRGATSKAPEQTLPIDDPDGLLTWLDAGRAMLQFTDVADVMAREVAVQKLLRDWIMHL